MKIPVGLCVLALCAALAGCGGSKPDAAAPKIDPAPPAGTGPETPAKESPAPSLPSSEPKETKPKETQVQGPPEPPRRADEQLRALAARLLEKNPQGTWRLNTAAALELEKLGGQAETDLVSLLGDAKPEVRRGAAYCLLAKFSAGDEKQVAGYVSLLDDQEPFLRGLALQAVRKMQKADQAANLPRLAKMLSAKQEPSEENRAALARLLGSLKQDAKMALGELTSEAKQDQSPKVRAAYLVAISQIAAPTESLTAFRQGLSDQDASVRLVAAARLRQLGKEAAPAAEDLGAALEDADLEVRESAAEALALVGPAAVEPLSKQVDSKKAHTRQLAIACLGKLGSDAKSALPHVEKHLKDEDPEVQKIAEAVARILKGS